jgi:hypothetical protein
VRITDGVPPKARQRGDHRLLAAHQVGGAAVCAELALAQEPAHDPGHQEPSRMTNTMVVKK